MNKHHTNENRNWVRKFVTLSLSLVALIAPAAARADGAAAAQAEIAQAVGFVPGFIKAMPANLLPGFWEETKGYSNNDKTALSGKTKDLIGLAIAAQLPSRLTVWSYGKCAKSNGATEAELKEAVAMASMTRLSSTFFNGVQLDETRFRGELAKLKENITKAAASGSPPPAPMVITNADSVYKEMQQSFGLVPEFARRFPPEVLPGVWLTMRDVEMNPQTALPGKVKSLISLAVAAQIPCRYCIIADTEFAKLEGATDREIAEAVTAGGLARQYITLVEGLQVDEKTYRRDWERLTARPHTAQKAVAPGHMASK